MILNVLDLCLTSVPECVVYVAWRVVCLAVPALSAQLLSCDTLRMRSALRCLQLHSCRKSPGHAH